MSASKYTILYLLSIFLITPVIASDEAEIARLNKTYTTLLERASTPYDKAKTLVRYSRKAAELTSVVDPLRIALAVFKDMEKGIFNQAYPLQSILNLEEVGDISTEAYMAYLEKPDDHLSETLGRQKLAYLYQDLAEVHYMLGEGELRDDYLQKAAWEYVSALEYADKIGKESYTGAIRYMLEQAEEVLQRIPKYADEQNRMKTWLADLFITGQVKRTLRVYDLFWMSKGKNVDLQDMLEATNFAWLSGRLNEAELYLTCAKLQYSNAAVLYNFELKREESLARIINYELLQRIVAGNLTRVDKTLSRILQEAMDVLKITQPVKTLFGEVPLRILDRKDGNTLYYYLRDIAGGSSYE